MRSESLIKKIGAAFTAVAVLASISLTTFAAEIENGDASDFDSANRVEATVTVEETSEGSGLYNVAIDYTNDASSAVGVTMLAYSDTADGNFTDSDIPDGYQETGMQIVGFDQSNDKESGTFNFLVDTNETSDADAIRMDKGDVGIVLLSADGATAPTGYLFAIPADLSFTVTSATVNTTEITVPYGTSMEDALAMLADVTITVAGDGQTENNWTATWFTITDSDGNDYDPNVPGTYKARGNLVKPDGSNGEIGTLRSVSVNVVVEAKPVLEWEITQGTLADVNITIDKGADVLAAVKAELMNGEKVINVTDADTATEYTATIAMTQAIADTAVLVETNTYRVTVADNSLVENESPVDSVATIVSGGFDVTFNVNVAYNPTGEFTATSVKAFDASNVEVTAIKVDNGTSEALAIDALKLKVAKATVYGINDTSSDASEDWTVTDWTIADYDAATAGDYTATATLQAPDNALATVPGDVTLTVTVTVKAAEGTGEGQTYLVGDVTGEGKIDMSDWLKILAYTKKGYSEELPETIDWTTNINANAADVDQNKKLDMSDWLAILAYTKTQTHDVVGTQRSM